MIASSSTADHFSFGAKYSQLSSLPSSPERRFKSISPCRRLFEDLSTNQNSATNSGFVVSNGSISNTTFNNTITNNTNNLPSNNNNAVNKYNFVNSVTKDETVSNCGSTITTIASNQGIVEGLTEILYSSYQRRKSLGGGYNKQDTTTGNNTWNTSGNISAIPNNRNNLHTSTASPFMDDLGFLSSTTVSGSTSNLMKKNSTIYEQENDDNDEQLLMSSPMRKPKNCSIRKPQIHWNRRIGDISSMTRRAMSESTTSKMSENGLIHHLPCFDSPHDAIKRISPDTLIDLLEGKFSGIYDRLLVIDCRYPYEFEGGHIPTALNVNNPEYIEELLFEEAQAGNNGSTAIVFHCEFSSERAPRMALHVRNLDRQHNKTSYPTLLYPEMYILDGGYKNYWQQHGDKCEPQSAYVPMRCPQYRDQLRQHQKMKYAYKSGCHLSQHSCVKRLPPKSKKPRSKSLNIANARKFFNDLISKPEAEKEEKEGEDNLSFNCTEEGGQNQHMFPSYTIPMVNSFSSIFASELDMSSEMDLD